jgi:hypothetical protein
MPATSQRSLRLFCRTLLVKAASRLTLLIDSHIGIELALGRAVPISPLGIAIPAPDAAHGPMLLFSSGAENENFPAGEHHSSGHRAPTRSFSQKGGNRNADKNTRRNSGHRALDRKAPRSASSMGCCSWAPHPSLAPWNFRLGSSAGNGGAASAVPVHLRDDSVAYCARAALYQTSSCYDSVPSKRHRSIAGASRQEPDSALAFRCASNGLRALARMGREANRLDSRQASGSQSLVGRRLALVATAGFGRAAYFPHGVIQ